MKTGFFARLFRPFRDRLNQPNRVRFLDFDLDDLQIDMNSSDMRRRLKLHEDRTRRELSSSIVRHLGNGKRGNLRHNGQSL